CNAGVCGPIGPTDGKKNGDETDVDCGGPTAPKCANGKACAVKTDCADDYCPEDTKKCTAPTYDDGVLNGTETDLDCGGTGAGMKKCAETKACLVDNDCNGACNYKKACVDAPSCKGQFGGDTCGTGESPDVGKNHQSCCRTLPVPGYADPNQAGKTVYLDKYEITAGRMRAFLEALGGGVDAAGNAKDANVKAWIAAHRPARWNVGWDNVLPTANKNSIASYTIINSGVVDPLYPGPSQYNSTQKLGDWMNNPGNYSVDVGIFRALGAPAMFPEYSSSLASGGVYSVAHALNCTNTHGGGGQSTYWFDAATIVANSEDGSVGKFFTKNQMDEKALNCTTFAMYAAFCAWDGGQLATAEVIDYITGNTRSPVYGPAPNFTQNGKLAIGNTVCGPNGANGANPLLTFNDGGSYPCYNVYHYPDETGDDYDDSWKVAPGGRVPADVIVKNAGDEPWMDLIGNLEEAVIAAGGTSVFDWRGFGHEYNSIGYHRLQMSTPRGKGGAFGARCMRFK
ncbi:MAG TPA: hypothetical protein VLT33_31275, partial [Labilithrix sp.]|nr:hypothetical protein [Labilithrix sp.]